MVSPVKLRDFLIVSLSLCFILIFFYFTQKTYLFWFLAFVPIFLAGWVWHKAGAFLLGTITLAATSVMIYLELLTQGRQITIPLPSLLVQIGLGFFLIFIGGLGVGRIAEIAAAEERIIKQITLKDSKTDLFTERYFRLRLEDEVRRSERFELPFSLLLIKVDTLEKFRDTFGAFHADLLLRKAARLLERCVREVDLLARWNDGFAVILPGVAAADAVPVAERIRASIAEAEFEGDEVEPRVHKTVSIGLAQFPEHAYDENELLEAARRALEEAQQQGGNRVVVSSPVVAGA